MKVTILKAKFLYLKLPFSQDWWSKLFQMYVIHSKVLSKRFKICEFIDHCYLKGEKNYTTLYNDWRSDWNGFFLNRTLSRNRNYGLLKKIVKTRCGTIISRTNACAENITLGRNRNYGILKKVVKTRFSTIIKARGKRIHIIRDKHKKTRTISEWWVL